MQLAHLPVNLGQTGHDPVNSGQTFTQLWSNDHSPAMANQVNPGQTRAIPGQSRAKFDSSLVKVGSNLVKHSQTRSFLKQTTNNSWT